MILTAIGVLAKHTSSPASNRLGAAEPFDVETVHLKHQSVPGMHTENASIPLKEPVVAEVLSDSKAATDLQT